MTEDDEFFAWLDGELDASQAAIVAARVAASPELSARADDHRRLASNLQNAFAPTIAAGVPPPGFASAEIVDLGARAAGREVRRPPFGVLQWSAMAATLALGLLVGNLVGRGGTDAPVAVDAGQLVAAASLGETLNSGLASAPAGPGPRIGLTFRDAKGHVCRSFQDGAASGLACRDGDRWQIRGLFQGAEGQSSDYRMAAGADPRLASLIDDTIAGEPFDAAQERTARQQGWK